MSVKLIAGMIQDGTIDWGLGDAYHNALLQSFLGQYPNKKRDLHDPGK